MYSSSLIRIPAPHFVVFYNGQKPVEEDITLKLSDAFEKTEADPALELKVRLININPGSSPELMARCKVLREYSEFVARIRKYIEEKASIREAVEQAVTECIQEGILEEFLLSQRSEVVAMSIFEYDHEVEMKKLADEMREQLREEVREEGREEGKAQFLLLVLNLRGTVPKWLKERILCERDSELLESWMKTAADAASVEDFLNKAGLKEPV